MRKQVSLVGRQRDAERAAAVRLGKDEPGRNPRATTPHAHHLHGDPTDGSIVGQGHFGTTSPATLRMIRERWPELPVLILTMYDDPGYVEQALQAGASGYVLKSITPAELVRAVRAVSEGRGYLQMEITRPVLERFALSAPMPAETPHLTPRERDLLGLLAQGRSNRQMAHDLGITEATVKGYLRDLFDKLGAQDRAHAVALALRTRLID